MANTKHPVICAADHTFLSSWGGERGGRWSDRATFTEGATWRRQDGTEYTVTRVVTRWGGNFCAEPGSTVVSARIRRFHLRRENHGARLVA